MKLIIAIVRPVVVDRLLRAFDEIDDFPGVTVSDAEGYAQRIRSVHDDPLEPLRPYRMLQIAVTAERVDEICDAIAVHAHTGKKGDGIVWVVPLERSALI